MRSTSFVWQMALIATIALVSLTSDACAAASPTRYNIASYSAPANKGKVSKVQANRKRAATPRRTQYSSAAYRIPTYYGSSLVNPSPISYAVSRAPNTNSRANSGDYLHQMNGESRWPEGKHIRVYVAPGRSSGSRIVSDCLNQWASAANHRFSWTFTSNKGNADYVIGWTTYSQPLSNGDEAGLTTTDTEVDPETNQEFIDHAATRILTRYEGRTLNDVEISKTMLHEIGHGLGLEGHSSNAGDIMYYAVSPKQTCRLTPRDANTMARLYCD